MILFDNHYSKITKFSQEKVRVDFAHRYHQADNEHFFNLINIHRKLHGKFSLSAKTKAKMLIKVQKVK